MAHQPTSSHSGEELLSRARASQRLARGRRARPEDAFLVDAVTGRPSAGHPTGVVPFSTSLHTTVCKYLKQKLPRNDGEGPHESEIRRILEMQDPTTSRRFNTDGVCASDTLPGRAPIVDHLQVKISDDPDWAFLKPTVDVIRSNRCPSAAKLSTVYEITLGESTPDQINEAIAFLKAKCKETRRTFTICQLTGDVESLAIPPSAWTAISEAAPGEPVPFRTTVENESGHMFAVRLMFGHLGWEVHLRLPINKNDTGTDDTLVVTGFQLQPEIYKLVEAAGTLAGIGITADIQSFNRSVQALFGTTLKFKTPLEVQPLARLAGYNLPRYAVDAVCWTVLGSILPKGLCSKGDDRWHEPWDTLPPALKAYLSADIGQVALITWCFTIAWLIHLFPDLHAVVKLSKFTSGSDLLLWWQDMVILRKVVGLHCPSSWTRAVSRTCMVDVVTSGTGHVIDFKELIPDWPSIVAGGCRFFHTARAFLISKLHIFRGFGGKAWPVMYREQVHIVRFSRREVPAEPSPTDEVRSSRMQPNPDVGDYLHGPAFQLSRADMKKVVCPGVCARSALLEYVRVDPAEGSNLLRRLEASRGAAAAILALTKKAEAIVHDLREMLGLFGMMPPRPPGWVDPYPPPDPVPQVKQQVTLAREQASKSASRGIELVRRSFALKKAITEVEVNPPDRYDSRCSLNLELNRRDPGNPDDDDAVFSRMGVAPKQIVASGAADSAPPRTVVVRDQVSPVDTRPDRSRSSSRSSASSRHYGDCVITTAPAPKPGQKSETVTSGAYRDVSEARLPPKKITFDEYRRRNSS